MENFDFISDNRLKIILERDYKELIKCFDAECYKSVLILSGSLIESIIVEFFLNKLPEGYTENKILRLELQSLIELGLENNLIEQKTKSLSVIVKDYRNLIHPGREIRLNEQFDKETANVSISLVKMIIKDIKKNYLKLYGYSAKDIISKISNDNVSIGIFDELIKKLNYQELLKLLYTLIETELSNSSTIDNIKQYIDLIKPYLKREDLLHQLNILHLKVETSQKWEILKMFNLFKEELDFLEDKKKDLIIKYVISVLDKVTLLSEIENIRLSRIINGFPKYIENSKFCESYKKMLCEYYSEKDLHIEIKYFYFQLINGLSKQTQDEFENYAKQNVVIFTRFVDDLDEVPF